MAGAAGGPTAEPDGQPQYAYGVRFVKSLGDGDDDACTLVEIAPRGGGRAASFAGRILSWPPTTTQRATADDVVAVSTPPLSPARPGPDEQIYAVPATTPGVFAGDKARLHCDDDDDDDDEPPPALPPRLYVDYGDIAASESAAPAPAVDDVAYGVVTEENVHTLVVEDGAYGIVGDFDGSLEVYSYAMTTATPPAAAAESRGSLLLHNMKALSRCGYYWGPISEERATAELADRAEGTFLLYDASHVHHLYALSVVLGSGVEHFLIDSYDTQAGYAFSHPASSRAEVDAAGGVNGQPAIAETLRWRQMRPSVIGLIDWAVQLTGKTQHRRGLHPYLVSPLVQPYEVPSLQHLIRSFLCDTQRLTRGQVHRLPVPRITQDYILQYGYFTA